MEKKEDRILTKAALAVAVCLFVAMAFFAGRASGKERAAVPEQVLEQEAISDQLPEETPKPEKTPEQISDKEQLIYTLNRGVMEKLNLVDGPIYVIGHRSPDSDTVCGAIAWARFLCLLGYDAEAAVTQEVNRETAYILKEAGAEAPPVLEDASGKNVFLVDHSEYIQAAEGMADAHIVGVIDHHGVGSVTTGHQVAYEARPLGATATLIWLNYLNCGFEPDRVTAQLLLGAVLSDTMNLTGSTTTQADRLAVPALAELAGVADTETFYRELHAESLSREGLSGEEILFSDYKEYEVNGVRFGIGLITAADEEDAAELAQLMKEAMTDGLRATGMDLIYASIRVQNGEEKTDYIVPADERSRLMIEAAFPHFDEYDGTAFTFRGGLGRKTLFVPGLTDYLNMVPHE